MPRAPPNSVPVSGSTPLSTEPRAMPAVINGGVAAGDRGGRAEVGARRRRPAKQPTRPAQDTTLPARISSTRFAKCRTTAWSWQMNR